MINNNNNIGYREFLTTLTHISSKIVNQKFYEIKNLPDYVDFEEEIGDFSDQLFKWSKGSVADDGETGIIGANGDNEKKASVDVVFEGKVFPRVQWAKKITYNWFDIKQANQVKIANLIEAKEEARKKNYDLMIQKIIFLGSKVNPNVKGLLTNNEATVDISTITQFLSQMSVSQWDGVIPSIVNGFLTNTNESSAFNRLIIPSQDYNGLSVPYSSYNNGTKLEVLENSFKKVLSGYGVNDFKILPSVYANAGRNDLNKNIYAVYNKNPDTMSFDVGIDYQMLGANTYDNFDFSSVAVSMFGGVNVFRPKELMYFEF